VRTASVGGAELGESFPRMKVGAGDTAIPMPAISKGAPAAHNLQQS
jgi:hypothetical protein